MKIALLTDGIHPYVIGGMQKHSFHLVRELARNKHTVYLFHCNESKYDASKLEFFTEEERQYIKPFLIPFPHKSYFPFHYIYESKLYSKTIYEALKPNLSDIDFIFAQGFCEWDLLEHKHDMKLPPVAIHFHGLEMFQHIPSAKARISRYFLQRAVKKNLKNCDYAISYGGKITTLLSSIVPKERIWEIPAAIEDSWINENISPCQKVTRFVFVGRYERRKGIPELNIAIRQLLHKSSFTFDFIGDIPKEHHIESPAIHYHGKISEESSIKKTLSQADVLICPSYAEGMPNVILEAMAQGLAIIATNVGATSLLVNNENGWLIKSPSPTEIESAMLKAIGENGNTLEKKKASSVSKIKNRFTLKSVTESLIQKIEQINK